MSLAIFTLDSPTNVCEDVGTFEACLETDSMLNATIGVSVSATDDDTSGKLYS